MTLHDIMRDMLVRDEAMYVLACDGMNLSGEDSLIYLKTKGFPMGIRKFYAIKNRLSAEAKDRAFLYAKNFLEDHVNVIDELTHIKKMMYEKANAEKDGLKCTMILSKIVETVIPYISAYKEATNQIMIEQVKSKFDSKDQILNISTHGIEDKTRREEHT